MKKEVIYYNGCSMGGFETCELLENNKVKVSTLDSGEKITDIQEHKILTFWDKIDELKIWKWKKEYSPKDEIEDGHQWELKLRNRNGRTRNFGGHMSYPDNYNDFIKELNNLFGSEIKDEKYEL